MTECLNKGQKMHLFLDEVLIVKVQRVELNRERAGIPHDDVLLHAGAVRQDRSEGDHGRLELELRLKSVAAHGHRDARGGLGDVDDQLLRVETLQKENKSIETPLLCL